MHQLMRLALLVLACIGLSACARTLKVTYHSDPEGAMLYVNESRQLFGYTPVLTNVQPSEAFLRGTACMSIQGSLVRWASGAEASISTLNACPQAGLNQQFVFVRPTGIPGREIDAQFAMALQQQAAAQEQGTPAASAATLLQAVLQGYADGVRQNQALRQTLHCTTRMVGNTVYTDCR
jgi:hypothetical protein